MDKTLTKPAADIAKIPMPAERIRKMRRSYNGQDPLTTSFPSVEAACDWLASIGVGTKYHVAMDKTGRPDYGPEWTWNHNTAQAMAMVRNGWPVGAAHVKTSHVDIANTFLSEHEEESTRYDVAGAFVDVATFLEGSPECMVEFCQERRETRAVRIMVDASVSGGVDADLIFKRGIAIMGAVLAVQASGVAVTVDLVLNSDLYTGDGDVRSTVSVTAHRPGDVLDTSRLACFLAHPAFTRLIMLGGVAYCLAGADNGRGAGKGKVKPGEIWIEDLMLDKHPWGSAEANKILIEKIFSAAV